ncbi:batD protein [Vibrio sp. JCM 19236]|nr:batD protein [Vibrio sp. JCM 19236]
MCFVHEPKPFGIWLQSYIEKGDIKVSVELGSNKVVPREQVQATLEIVSKYPLKDEIVLPYLDVDNGIVKSDEQGVLRSSKMIEGERWYSQSTKIYVYPMQHGRFVLPSFDVAVTLLNDKTSVSGVIKTPEAGFDVTASSSAQEYVAGSEASFTVTGASEEELKSGDAVTLTYVLSVKASHTMLLPEFKPAEISGAERYVKPLQKENQYNRLSKSNTAILTQEVTYIFLKRVVLLYQVRLCSGGIPS